MSPRQIELVQQSWARLAPAADAAGRLFYDNLFALDPALKPLFGGDIDAQARKLMSMIGFAVGRLHRLEALLPGLQALGARHAGYGVRDEHYDTVGRALLATLREGLGEAFDAEHEQAWASVYAALAGAMRQVPDRIAA
jgi:hemoglobin-like flavoprotein